MSDNKVCIVLPCYKVKNQIYSVYKKLITKKIDSLIFVDDKCPENSVNFLKTKIKKNKKVKYIFLKKNLGVGGATLEGFRLAEKKKYDIIVKFDADDQHKITDLDKIINILKKNDNIFCKGYRNLSLKSSLKRKMPLIRIIGANALTLISKITTKNFKLKDVTNGLFGMSLKIYKFINLKNIKKNYFFEQDLIFRVCKSNIKIIQIRSEVIYGNEKSSLNELRSVIPFLFYHFKNFFYKD
jgi:dolichol-phosphate mannosyltransferase